MKPRHLDPDALSKNPRATLSIWTRYRRIVEAAYAAHPQTYIYTTSTFATSTVQSQLRDCIRGAIVFSYPCAIPTDTLARWYDSVIIRHDNTYVYIGPPPEKHEDALQAPVQAKGLVFPLLVWDEFEAFVLLLSRGCIQGPITITKPEIAMTNFETSPNVTIISRSDGSLTLF